MSKFFDRRLLTEAQEHRLGLALTIGLGALGGVATVGGAFALSRTVAGVFLGGLDLTGVRPWLLALVGFAVLRALTIWGGEVAANQVALRVKTALRSRLMAHILALGPAYIRGERTGELVNTATEGIEALDAYFSQYLPQLALAAIVPLTLVAFVLPRDPLSAVVLIVTAPLIPVFMMLIGSVADTLTQRQWVALSRMSAHFLDILQGLTTLKLFNRSREQIAVIRQVTDQHRDATLRVLRVAFLSALVLEMVGTISTAIIAVEIGLRLLYGRMLFQDAFFVLILAPEFYLPLRLLGTRFHAGITGVSAAQRIFGILEMRGYGDAGTRGHGDAGTRGYGDAGTRGYGDAGTRGRGDAGTRGRGDLPISPFDHLRVSPSPRLPLPPLAVSFHDVYYTYPGRTTPALAGVSFEIKPGEKVALVGPTGAGKSTIAQLLLGFIQPASGTITISHSTFHIPDSAFDLPPSAFSPAWMPQSPYLFHASVADNIRLGRPDATAEEIVRAAQAAGADDFIRALPQGYDTLIGERGERLSGGQAQRIALARALLMDAPLVVLDEPTANLDLETEAAVQAGIERLLKGRTAVIIAHRLNTVRAADRIIVLDAGKIVEQGTHDQLMALRGVYAHLVEESITGLEAVRQPPSGSAGSPHDATDRLKPRFQEDAQSGLEVSAGSPHDAADRLKPRFQDQDNKERHTYHAPRSTQYAPRSTQYAPRSTQYAVRSIVPLLAFLAPHWRWVALSVLLGFLTVGSSIGLLGSSAWIIATAALQPSIADLQVAIVGVRFFGISRGVFRYLERLVSHQVTFRLLAELRVWFYSAIEPLAPKRLAGQRSGDLLSRIVADIAALEQFFVRVVSPPLTALLTSALAILIVGLHHPTLIWPLLLFFVLTGLATPVIVQALAHPVSTQLAEGRAALSAALVDGVQGAADLLACKAEGAYLGRVRELSEQLGRVQAKAAAIAALNTALGVLFSWLAVAAVLKAAIPLVTAGMLSGVSLAVLALVALAGFEGVLPLPQAAQALRTSLAAARRLFELVREPSHDLPAVTDHPAASRHLPEDTASRSFQPDLATAPAIRTEHLTMFYTPDDPPALADVSFAVPAGGRVAVVGSSGAGKSSLAAVLLRLWDYQGGRVWLHDRELQTLSPEWVRRQIAAVTQHTHLFNMTIRDNLLLARPEATQAELEQAARLAQIHDFISSLPDGYDTWIGEQGLQLSGGERQRLAIARALLKDAPALILDEPTANLDPTTAHALLNALAAHTAGKTTILITHRLEHLRGDDQVLFLDRGRLVATGSHADLLAREPLYQRLWQHQHDRLELSGQFWD